MKIFNSLFKGILLVLVAGVLNTIHAQTTGVLYGTTFSGGGRVFKYDPVTSKDSVVFVFNSSTGNYPAGNLIQASNGMLYGMTTSGGVFGYGIIFMINPVNDTEHVLYNFNGTEGKYPYGSLCQANNGLLYGMTEKGGNYNDGVLFSYNIVSGTLDTLFSFNGTNGANPFGNVMQASNGLLYGMTANGGSATNGVLFSYNPLNNKDSTILSFVGSNGDNPNGSLIQVNDSLLYGMDQDPGVIFSLNIYTNKQTILHNFSTATGKSPLGSLIMADNGILYGVTNGGGYYGYGVVFSYDTASATYDTLFSFNSNNGQYPQGSLIQAANRILYGMSILGGPSNVGDMFSYNITSKRDSVVLDMVNVGATPYADVLEVMSGKIVTTNNKCFGDSLGTASIHLRGGEQPITYKWSNGAPSADSVSKLPAGNYTVQVTDAIGKGLKFSFTITQPKKLKDSLLKQNNENCFGQSIGYLAANIKGGIKPYSYSWLPGMQPDTSISGLTAGSYTFMVKDSNSCVDSVVATITQPALLKDSINSVVNPLCYGQKTGQANVAVIGGTKPYNYNWTGGAGNDSIAINLIAGSYTCQVTDTKGCKTNASVAISSPPAIKDSGIYSSTPCTKTTGMAGVVNVSGGVSPYTYIWSPGSNTNNIDTALSSGAYTCTITDSNNCQVHVNVFVPNTGGPKDSLLNQTNETCFGQSMGAANIRVKGGKLPYTFQWSPSGGNDTITSGLYAGSYTFAATDSIGCVNTLTVTITQPAQLIDTLTTLVNVNCYGLKDGLIKVGVTGGTLPYFYSWVNTIGTDSIANNLMVGSYTCNVNDSRGCTSVPLAVNVTGPSQLVVDSSSTPAKCGVNNGSVSVNAAGGVSPYTYAWSPVTGTNSFINGVKGGIDYTCNVTDANGCINKVSITVADTGGPQAFINVHDQIKCYGDSSGIAVINVTKGAPPYTYSWSPVSSTNAFAVGLGAGIYYGTVTDSTGCKQTDTIKIGQPAQLTDSIHTIGVCNSFITGGQAEIFVTGGVPPYSYLWSTNSTNDSINNTGPGAYVCTVTDSNKCKLYATCNIIPALSLKIDSVVSHPSLCDTCNDGWVKAYVSGGIPKGDSIYYLYVWDNAQTTDSIRGLSAGIYHVCVTTNYCANQTVCDSAYVVSGLARINESEEFSMYPIPTSSTVTVQLPEMGRTNISVFNELGDELFSCDFGAYLSVNKKIINIEAFPPGVYLVQVKNAQMVLRKKMIVVR